MSIKGTKTEQNLLKSFAGESQARSRYTFFASVAKNEGYEPVSYTHLDVYKRQNHTNATIPSFYPLKSSPDK